MEADEDVAAGRNCNHESTSGHNNASNNFTCEFMDLDEFFTATAAAVGPLADTAKTRSREENNQPCILNTLSVDVANTSHSVDTSCSRHSDELNNEIQEVPRMSIESSLDGGSTNSFATKNTSRKQKSGRKSSRRCANSHAAVKDNTYWDRRVKNNIAAKRSRDSKRLKEVNVVERWKFLEKENKRLKKQLANMKEHSRRHSIETGKSGAACT